MIVTKALIAAPIKKLTKKSLSSFMSLPPFLNNRQHNLQNNIVTTADAIALTIIVTMIPNTSRAVSVLSVRFFIGFMSLPPPPFFSHPWISLDIIR